MPGILQRAKYGEAKLYPRRQRIVAWLLGINAVEEAVFKLPAGRAGIMAEFRTGKTITDQEILCHAFDHGITHFDLTRTTTDIGKQPCGEKFRTGIKGLPWYIPG